jgi:hypothetical protein
VPRCLPQGHTTGKRGGAPRDAAEIIEIFAKMMISAA